MASITYNMDPLAVLSLILLGYVSLVRSLRCRRAQRIKSEFGYPHRSLSTMTLNEACAILRELEQLEFPYGFHKGRALALLKAGAFPSMTKLFMATGQSNAKNATKRAIDTKIILQEAQLTDPESDRQLQAIARMNYFHARYRKAGKILDEDMLHTLGAGIMETTRAIDTFELRKLTEAERCALGVFHRALGEAMGIPYKLLPSATIGWDNGVHFGKDLVDWCIEYERTASTFAATNKQYADTYITVETWALPSFIRPVLYKVVAMDLYENIRTSLGLEEPGAAIAVAVSMVKVVRKFMLRYLSLPRPRLFANTALQENANLESGHYQYNHHHAEPWYMKQGRWATTGPSGFLRLLLGGSMPSTAHSSGGYDLMTIGPLSSQGKGIEEMNVTLEHLRSLKRGSSCPFQHEAGSG